MIATLADNIVARLRALRITRKPKASGLSAKESVAPKSLSRKG